MTTAVSLTGTLLRLEPLAVHHAGQLLAAATEAGARYDFTSVPTDAQTAASYIRSALGEQARGTALVFAIVDLSRQRAVGSTRFLDLVYWTHSPPPTGSQPGRWPPPSAVEIGGTWLAPSAQRTGINTEAKLLMLTQAFGVWEVHRVTLKTDARNTRSRTAIERIGAFYEGTRRAHLPALDGTIRDTAYYSILAAEWPTIRQRLHELLDPGDDRTCRPYWAVDGPHDQKRTS
jgi:RimJ/RimL family protein N-acetyltransferase